MQTAANAQTLAGRYNARPLFANECDLYTARKYVEAATVLRRVLPGYHAILAGEMTIIATRKLPTAGTDGFYCYINPEYFFNLPTPEHRAFLLGHEAGHGALRHGLRARAYKARGSGPDGFPLYRDTYNEAADFVINADLVAAGLPLIDGALLSDQWTREHLVDDVYTALARARRQEQQDQQQEDADGAEGGGEGEGEGAAGIGDGEGHDIHLDPDYTGTTDEREKAQREDAERIERATDTANDMAAQAYQDGETQQPPSEALRNAGRRATLASGTDWRTELHDLLTRAGRGGEANWNRINRRRFSTFGLVTPSTRGAVSLIAITVDISSSVDRDQLSRFLQEVASAIDNLRPTEGVLVLFTNTRVISTAQVYSGEELLSLQVPSGGGTRMAAAARWLEDNGYTPDIHLCFTDGELWGDDWARCATAGMVMVLDSHPTPYTRTNMAKAGARAIIAARD